MTLDKILDLKVGDPDFTRDYWKERLLPCSIPFNRAMAYNPIYIKESLRNTIKEMHNTVQNAETAKCHVVLGVGATQILSAAMYALTENGAPREVFVRKPYYYRLPELIALSGCIELTRPKSHYTELVVTPNNPNNETKHSHSTSVPDKIYDLCYNWPQYTITKKYNENIMVFSLAKCTGHASSRIGWALVKNTEVAERMNHFIEQMTGGPSMESMVRAQSIMDHLLVEDECSNFFLGGRDILIDRWNQLGQVSNPFFKTLNSSGMFAWCQYGHGFAHSDLLRDLSIDSISGPISGGKINQLRLNIGCKEEDFIELIRRLNLPLSKFEPDVND